MSELTPEEKALLEAAETDTVRKTRPRGKHAESAGNPERGPHTPVQFEDDGWNGLPVQMRG